jgi:exodeoxyribonuclease VII small subunit
VTRKSKLPTLEHSLGEINSLIEKMEKGELTLEQSLECFERGITLIKNSQKILQEAEQKVQILLKSQTFQEGTLTDYENDQE